MEKLDKTLAVAWIAYLGAVIYLANLMGAVVIPVAAIMMVPLIVMMNIIAKRDKVSHKMSSAKGTSKKRKRKSIDNMIRDMSDDELYELRQRLQDGDFEEDEFYGHISDDGELVRR